MIAVVFYTPIFAGLVFASMSFSQGIIRVCLLLVALAGGVVQAATVQDLYVAAVSVPDRSEAARRKAFIEALGQVAVRVSGSRAAPERLGSAIGDVQRYVQRFGYLAQNQLQVGFDARAVDELLNQAGLPIWGRERPLTFVSLQVEDASGARRFVTSATAGPERDAIIAAANFRGVPLQWAGTADALSGTTQLSASELDAERQRLGADALLLGFATRSGAGTTVRWQLSFGDRTRDTAGSVESGIHLAADTFADIYAAASGSVSELLIEVSGVPNLDAYARTVNYLEGLTLVRSVSVLEVNRDALLLRVVSRGDAETLRRALALDDELLPESLDQSAPDPQRLRVRLQPAR